MQEQFHNYDAEISTIVPHCPVMLVLDTSHSMWGQGLSDLKQSLVALFATIEHEEFQNAQIDVAAVSMGDNLGMLEEFTPIHSSQLPGMNIRPKGDTPIGAALELACQKLDAEIAAKRQQNIPQTTPQLIVLSDGESSDDFAPAAAEIQARCARGELFCRVIALGNQPNRAALQKISGAEPVMVNDLPMADNFTDVGKMVSQTYEEEVPQHLPHQAAEFPHTLGAENWRGFVIDGTNLIYWDRSQTGCSLRPLLTLTDYLESQQIEYQVVFDASTVYKLPAAEKADYENLVKSVNDKFMQVPAQTCADDFILMVAETQPDYGIISQDCYRDHFAEHPWLDHSPRLIKGMVCASQLMLPKIAVNLPLK